MYAYITNFSQTVREISSIFNMTNVITHEESGNDHEEAKLTNEEIVKNVELTANIDSMNARLNLIRNGISFLLSKSVFVSSSGAYL